MKNQQPSMVKTIAELALEATDESLTMERDPVKAMSIWRERHERLKQYLLELSQLIKKAEELGDGETEYPQKVFNLELYGPPLTVTQELFKAYVREIALLENYIQNPPKTTPFNTN